MPKMVAVYSFEKKMIELKHLPNVRSPGGLKVFRQNALKQIEFPFSYVSDWTVLAQQ